MTDQTTSRRAGLSGRDWIWTCVLAHVIASYLLFPAVSLVGPLCGWPPIELRPASILALAASPIYAPYCMALYAIISVLGASRVIWGEIPFLFGAVLWWSYGIFFGLSALLLVYAFRRRRPRGEGRNGRWLRLGSKTNGT